MSDSPFELVSTTEIYRNPWISLREDSVVRPGGRPGIFGVVTMKDGSTVLAIDDEGSVLVTDEYHYAAGWRGVELVSGGLETGEAPLDAAKRELEEEAGYVASEWIDLGHVDPFTGVVKSRNYIFLARGLTRTNDHPDDGEIVNLGRIPYAEALRMAHASEITHAASVCALLKAEKYLRS